MWPCFSPTETTEISTGGGYGLPGHVQKGNELEFHLHSLLVHNLLQYASGMRDVSGAARMYGI